jgi:diaminopimelate epimerase
MRVSFIKMHGLGNDFVMLDARTEMLPPVTGPFARAIADRKTGIGCDQLILLEASTKADLKMRIFNADGGEVESCGNATRAIGLLLGKPARIETSGGMLEVTQDGSNISVTFEPPKLDWEAIPLAYAVDTLAMPVGWNGLENPAAVNVGNPHAVFFVEDMNAVDLENLGPQIEHDPIFPERVNVNVATIGDDGIDLRVWERGVGETRACGTGACATAIAAIRRGLAQSPVEVRLKGGTLTIGWDGAGSFTMTGSAKESFRGTFEWDDFA